MNQLFYFYRKDSMKDMYRDSSYFVHKMRGYLHTSKKIDSKRTTISYMFFFDQ